MARLPKQFWRVVVHDKDGKLRGYDRASKTYAMEEHAQRAIDGFRRQGIECELYESEPLVWKCVDAGEPQNMDRLFE